MSETRYLNENGEQVSVCKSPVGNWVVMAKKAGRSRLLGSKFMPPRSDRKACQTNLDAYAAVKGWQAVEEAPALL